MKNVCKNSFLVFLFRFRLRLVAGPPCHLVYLLNNTHSPIFNSGTFVYFYLLPACVTLSRQIIYHFQKGNELLLLGDYSNLLGPPFSIWRFPRFTICHVVEPLTFDFRHNFLVWLIRIWPTKPNKTNQYLIYGFLS